MRLIEAILEFLGEIAWPIAAIVIGLKFKKELAALLIRLKRGKLGSAEFEFERYVDAVDAETEIPRMPDVEAISPKAAIRATVDPRGAIVGAWIEVEEALLNLIQNRELSEPAVHSKSRGLVSAINAVQRAQVLDSSWVALFHDLRVMRNEAAHSTEFTPPPESVIKYVQLAKELTNAMRTAADQKNG